MSYELKTKAAVAAGALAAAFMTVANPAAAQDIRDIGEREPLDDNSRPGASVRPALHFPARGDTSLSVDASATYGTPVSPFVIAPGARFAGYFGSDGAVTGMPVVEAMLPIGAIVPYLKTGVGVGHATRPADTSLAFMAGGGVDVHVTRDVLVGVDATYENVIGTGFSTVAIGPRAGLRY
jgi:hypothetical protein